MGNIRRRVVISLALYEDCYRLERTVHLDDQLRLCDAVRAWYEWQNVAYKGRWTETLMRVNLLTERLEQSTCLSIDVLCSTNRC